MLWNRPRLIKAVKAAGYAGELSKNEIKSWMEANGLVLPEAAGDVEAIWQKTVTITADAGEEIVVEEVGEPDPIESEMVDGEDEDDEDVAKSRRVNRARVKAASNANRAAWGRSAVDAPSVRGRFASQEAAYDRRAKSAGAFWSSGEQALAFAAYIGAVHRKGKGLGLTHDQRDILSKALVESIESQGGYAVPVEFLPELIENVTMQGAVRRAYGAFPIPGGGVTIPRHLDDAVVTWSGEAEELTEQDRPTGNTVTLTPHKATALMAISNELLDDAQIDMTDRVANSVARGFARAEDKAALSGAGPWAGSGLKDLVGSNSLFDAALSTGWGDYVSEDILEWQGKLPGTAQYMGSGASIICSANWYATVLRNIAMGSGGATPQDFFGGIGRVSGPNADFDGIPVYFTDVLPRSYTADQIVAYYGNFPLACKFGEVRGGLELDSDSSAGFTRDVTLFRAKERVAIVNHDVNNSVPSETTAGSFVVALRD